MNYPSCDPCPPIEHRDGHGRLFCYPDGSGKGRLSRDFGGYGAIWATDVEEIGIFPGPDGEFSAWPGTRAVTPRTFKTLRGAIGHMRRSGRDPYGRPLADEQ